jgi:hypothetical protein
MTLGASCDCHYINALWFKVRELPFLLYQFELENVAVSFVLYFVVCNKSELVKNSQLRIVDWGQYLSVRLVNNIESCEIKN